MNILEDELIDSMMTIHPPIVNSKFFSLPSNDSSGNSDMTMKRKLNGMKQTMNSVEIIATMEDTFWFLLEAPSPWKETEDFFLHLFALDNLKTNITVQMMMITKELSGTKALLMAKKYFSTVWPPLV